MIFFKLLRHSNLKVFINAMKKSVLLKLNKGGVHVLIMV